MAVLRAFPPWAVHPRLARICTVDRGRHLGQLMQAFLTVGVRPREGWLSWVFADESCFVAEPRPPFMTDEVNADSVRAAFLEELSGIMDQKAAGILVDSLRLERRGLLGGPLFGV